MSLKSALKFAKSANEEKMGYRFQFPISMKDEFEIICEKNGVSMTDMILGLINSAIEEEKGFSDSTTLTIINKIDELEKEIRNLDELYQKTGEDILELSDGTFKYLREESESAKLKLKALQSELKRRDN